MPYKIAFLGKAEYNDCIGIAFCQCVLFYVLQERFFEQSS